MGYEELPLIVDGVLRGWYIITPAEWITVDMVNGTSVKVKVKDADTVFIESTGNVDGI